MHLGILSATNRKFDPVTGIYQNIILNAALIAHVMCPTETCKAVFIECIVCLFLETDIACKWEVAFIHKSEL